MLRDSKERIPEIKPLVTFVKYTLKALLTTRFEMDSVKFLPFYFPRLSQ